MNRVSMNDGKICISVCAKTADELIEQIKRAEVLADVIEIRFDELNQEQFDSFLSKLKILRKTIKVPFLATLHSTKTTNGNCGTAIRYGVLPAILCKIGQLQVVDFIDIDYEFLIGKMLDFETKQSLLNLGNTHKTIGSFHDFDETPLIAMLQKYRYQLSKNSDIAKIAVHTKDITDTIPIWKLLGKAKSENKQIIPIAMGESGKWTRILGLAHGAFMTYAALDTGQETAPGQVSAKDLIEVYRTKELDEQTEVYGILGNNTSVSMSPYIHNAAFKFHGLNSVFVPLQVHDLDEFMRRMVKPETREIELNFAGFSVTIPHKQNIIKHLDFIDETAKKIGAVNTVKIVDGKLHGYNTDAQGFIEPLLNSYGDLTDAKVAVLGTGGAARACVYALKTHGADVTIFARDLAKAKDLAEDFDVSFADFKFQISNFKDFDILINITPLGMKGKAEGETPVLAEQLKGLHLVYDLVYIPFQTQLMNEADAAEVPKIGGLAMLIAQAMQQQKIWTGKDAPMKEMSRAVLERLQ
jgi:3-dehydroquinate dehydratase / shikimate dehydrogenase